ncbi:hypothetical protein VT84_01425 [Gemmata sp. SH-PL17]|uniref:hypothetical protein n=1 Tax=Gemmata sp. SH-PL17 TaxID=1630693 RepID=UPI00078D0DDC|nr:hypothetical protein [Gemmata sp. SH-PL17]AMV23041.1 hypothetical protein VT84_01425 [Gemmata sp. SH-PL17]
MTRILFALAVTVGFADLASAQQNNLPLSPGVRPVMPAGIGAATSRPDQPGVIYFPAIAPWGWATGWAYQSSYSPWTGFGYTFGGYLPNGATSIAPAQEAPAQRPQKPQPRIVLANEFPATLALQFPAAAEIWFNGEKVKGEAQDARTLTSPVLRPGTQYTFEVKARWKNQGKLFESARTVTLGPGDHSRLLVVSGTEVPE